MPIEIEIADTQGHLRVDRGALAWLVRQVLSAEHREHAEISIALVDDTAIHVLNRTHLAHDWPTDVLSFPFADADDRVLAGELVISAERAVAAAAENGLDPQKELALYVVHGLLHLCGYDDRTEADARLMRERQDQIISGEGLTHTRAPHPHAERESPGEPFAGG
jgi:probable rRNA maturation factor